MTTHTPRPWHQDWTDITDEAGAYICDCESPETAPLASYQEQVANAVLIVHCVNTYPVLLEALEAIRDSTRLDAEAPELRAQNQNVHRMTLTALALAKKVEA